MYVDLESHLRELSDRGSPDAVSGRIAWHEYPDLQAYRDPSGRIIYCSPGLTPFLDHIDIRYDEYDRVYAQAWTTDLGVVLHGDPPVVFVGIRNLAGFGDIPNQDWREYMEGLGLDPALVKKVADHFQKHVPVYW